MCHDSDDICLDCEYRNDAEEYIINGTKYPKYSDYRVNDHAPGADWTETHYCIKDKKEFEIDNGCDI